MKSAPWRECPGGSLKCVPWRGQPRGGPLEWVSWRVSPGFVRSKRSTVGCPGAGVLWWVSPGGSEECPPRGSPGGGPLGGSLGG